ncbi:MAG: Glucose-6-phosphate dehydrogenase, binding domain, partial [Chloroflexota bacterium]|nr:Glucose-6-phosphate dehydrogenase, binding domain [Chloroflexota bacterium]
MTPRVDLVIFGASGDLAQRKILPSLKRLATPDGMALRIIGAGRTAQSTAHFRDIVKKRS